MKRLLALPLLGLLAACATPQESCINNARAEMRAVQERIQKTQADIDRGYAVHVTREPFTVLTRCTDSNGAHFPCERTRYNTKEQPVTIDVEAERRKLVRLADRLESLQLAMSQQIEQCRAIYPE